MDAQKKVIKIDPTCEMEALSPSQWLDALRTTSSTGPCLSARIPRAVALEFLKVFGDAIPADIAVFGAFKHDTACPSPEKDQLQNILTHCLCEKLTFVCARMDQ